jgi:DNA-binding Lrp family transcriptional regulator
LRDIQWKVLSELIRNSRRSDRELARDMGSSQPTVTRARNKLEKEGYIKEYTAIPDFRKLGYRIMALTFVKLGKGLSPEEVDKARKIAQESMKGSPFATVMLERGQGLGHEGVIISYHENYASCMELRRSLRKYTFLDLSSVETFMINLDDKVHYRPLTFYALAEHLLKMKQDEKK